MALKIPIIFSILGTPTEQVWSGVTQLPDYKPHFPKWSDVNLAAKMQAFISKDGIDLLNVS